MSESIKNLTIPEGIKYGAIVAVISFVITLIFYVIDIELVGSFWAGTTVFIITLIALVFFGLQFRNKVGGYLNYGQALGFLMIATVTFALLGVIFNWLLYNVIDTSLPEQLNKVQIETTISMMESMNASDEQIDEAVTQAENQDVSSIPVLIQGSVVLIIIFGLVNLLLALIVKKSRPDFE